MDPNLNKLTLIRRRRAVT